MTVLACIDGSRYTPAVCEYAARAAKRIGAGVSILHVIEPESGPGQLVDRSAVMTANLTDETLELFTRVNEERRRLDQEHGQLLVEQAIVQVRARGIEHVEAHMLFGTLVDGLDAYATDARFVVLGKRGLAEQYAQGHLGMNLERVVRASKHPVLIVPAEPRPLRHFVVAYDGSASANKIITMLQHETLLLEASCTLVHVGPDTEQHRAVLADAAGALRTRGYSVTELHVPGHADEAIRAAVEQSDADLLVMGAFGHSRIRELIIGSTTTALLRASPVPVLVIR